MTGTRNPSRKYFKRNQPYFYKSVDNWEEWDTDESYNRTFFIGVDDSNQEDINVTLYMIWGGKPVAVVGSRVLDTVSSVVDTARLLEEEIQSILEEVQELTVAVAQARIDIEEVIIEMDALVDRCEGILEGAEAARDLAMDWATKIDGMVEEEGEPVDYSAKYYAYAAKDSESAAAGSASNASDDADLAEDWATKMDETVDGSEYSSKYYADQSAGSAATAVTKAGEASDSATLASKWATQLTTPVGGGEYSAKQYAQNAGTSATNASGSASAASGSATAASNSATLAQEWAAKMDGLVDGTDYSSKYYAGQSATSAQDAQDALDSVNGLIATPIGTVFQSIYVDEAIDIARQLNGQLIPSTKFYGFRVWLDTVQAYNPNLFTTESNWQAEITNSKLGQCGKFVIDDTAGTIRLPCVVNAQGLVDLALIGGIKSESLPNITGAAGQNGYYGAISGAFYGGSAVSSSPNMAGYTTQIYFNASRSSSTYQDNAPVQQEAIQYPYYIQVATGVEETLPAIREYEINTPFFFGQSMYSDVNPDNASWLVSNGSYNAKSVYPDYYDWLLTHVDETITTNGGKVVLSTGTITDYDWVVNTGDETFRLPLLDGSAAGNGDLYYYVGDTVQDASLINAGAVLGQLSDKISRTAASDKELVVGWGMPDYSAGVSFPIPYNNPYTADSNGWVVGYIIVGSGYFNNIFVNGSPVQQHASNSFGTIFPVSKGDIVTTDASDGIFTFYPCKGA